MARIKIGKVQNSITLVQQIADAGYDFTRNEEGETTLLMSFPGVAPVALTHGQILNLAETVDAPTPQGSDPAAVFARSAQEDPEGNLSARFSDVARSRSVSIPFAERGALASLLSDLAGDWADYTEQLESAEAAGE